MTDSDHPRQSRLAAVVDGWRAFWFSPQPAYSLGLVRMAFGALVVAWTLALLPDLYELFGEHGVVPQHPRTDYRWGVFETWTGDTALLIGWVVLLMSAIAMTVGWHSRLAAVLVFVLIASFMQRDGWVFNTGDALIRLEALFLALASCGAALSLDQRRRTGSFWSAQCRAPWLIRLMQVQLSVIYLVSVQAKLRGRTWVDGTAVSYAWREDQGLALIPAPEWLSTNGLIVNVATWGTIVIELAIAILVWNRRWRPWVLAAGVVMHLMMMVNLSIGFFSLAMFVLYLAFVPWEAVPRLPVRLKHLVRRDRGSSAASDSSSVHPAGSGG
ncbi:MAG: HTTM domain-containing protein [Mycobacterium sp.]